MGAKLGAISITTFGEAVDRKESLTFSTLLQLRVPRHPALLQVMCKCPAYTSTTINIMKVTHHPSAQSLKEFHIDHLYYLHPAVAGLLLLNDGDVLTEQSEQMDVIVDDQNTNNNRESERRDC